METKIDYVYNTAFVLENETKVSKWLAQAAMKEGFSVGEVVYAFFNDEDLKSLNNKHLNHDYFTDVISFNDSKGTVLNGNIAISIDRVRENAERYKRHLTMSFLGLWFMAFCTLWVMTILLTKKLC
jgi:ssRNA-specific RNase YbeY (16S rRNA maturation enzyme)